MSKKPMDYRNVMAVIDDRLEVEAAKNVYSQWKFSHLAAALWWFKQPESSKMFHQISYHLNQAEAFDLALMLQKYREANSNSDQ